MVVLNLAVDPTEFERAGAGFEPLPEGKYKVSIFGVEPDTIKQGPNKDKLKLKFQFKVKEGEKFANRRIFADVNTFGGISGPNSKNPGTPYGPFDFYALAKAVGYSPEQLAALDTDELLGKELEVDLEHTYKRIQNSEGSWIPSDELHEDHPKYREVKEVIKGYRSLKNAAKSAVANAGGGSKASKYSL